MKDIAIKQRHVPRNPEIQDTLNREIESMMTDGIIESPKSPWSSPMVIVRKRDGRARFCIDFRRLNSVAEKIAYLLPFMHSILGNLRAAK